MKYLVLLLSSPLSFSLGYELSCSTLTLVSGKYENKELMIESDDRSELVIEYSPENSDIDYRFDGTKRGVLEGEIYQAPAYNFLSRNSASFHCYIDIDQQTQCSGTLIKHFRGQSQVIATTNCVLSYRSQSEHKGIQRDWLEKTKERLSSSK